MIFDSLKEKCEFYRSLTDYKLLPNGFILVMIDGKNFSRLIKNKFEKPFDDWFIDTMNKTAEHLCKNIQGVVGAFVQSDEISLLITDGTDTSTPFGGRLCKLLSIIPSTATAFFMKQIIKHNLDMEKDIDFDKFPDYLFDCKVWNVPNENEAFAWFLYRQIDCVRNSKQQFCQSYIPHKQLLGKTTDEQVVLCRELTGEDWNTLADDKKYGRLLYKNSVTMTNNDGQNYERSVWSITSKDLTIQLNKSMIMEKWV